MRACAWFATFVAVATANGVSALTPLPLVGTVWRWSAAGDAAEAARYTVEFLTEGALRVQADCNSGKGRYEHRDDLLRVERVATTKKACGERSRGDEFVQRLASVDGYRYEGVSLVLTTGGAASLRLVPDTR